jgi:hypothetical protein
MLSDWGTTEAEECDPEAPTQRDPRGEGWEAEVEALLDKVQEMAR